MAGQVRLCLRCRVEYITQYDDMGMCEDCESSEYEAALEASSQSCTCGNVELGIVCFTCAMEAYEQEIEDAQREACFPLIDGH